MSNSDRFEINHNCEMVVSESALSEDVDTLIQDLFTQNNWKFQLQKKESCYRKVTVSSPDNTIIYSINLFIGNVRNESRNSYEKKIQLNGLDPRQYKDGITIILGFYVFNKDDKIKDSIIVGYPVKQDINYPSNPSLRRTFVNKILIDAKINGISIDNENQMVAFRPEFIFYYLKQYKFFQGYSNNGDNLENINKTEINKFPRNRIIFGAPGTGKSFQLKQESTDGNHFANIERVTFHPDYSYGQFVGNYKPVSDDEGRIRYEYVPGPFMRTLVKALESGKNGDSAEKFLLIVEEINRAKVAAVFGDMFQLLDRTDAGDSVYEIQASEDVRRYLARELGGTKENYTSIKIPNNMYIWATMNSADQGVFPMDTAFKRRWEFEYIGIDENEKEVKDYEIPVCKNDKVSQKIYWNELRKALNDKLISLGVNEDKLLGPFFLSKSVLESAMSKGMNFVKLFESKVLMYLFEDAAKMKVRQLFNLDSGKYIYSEVCKKFEKDGLDVFNLESTVAHSDLQKGTQNE